MPSLGARPQPQSFHIRKMVLLTPNYGGKPLYWAEKESDELLKLIPTIDRPSPADLKCFEDLLDSGDVQVVHFNGHGEWDNSGDLASLRVSDTEVIQAMAFSGRRLGKMAHPILYLNACSVGRNTERLGQPGGFCATCLRNGWSGVIAPYWKIYDPQAMQFGVDLYRKLKSGISIGEALQQLRRDQPDNFTAQSYSYFGDPHARLLMESSACQESKSASPVFRNFTPG
jgi:CHAT domain